MKNFLEALDTLDKELKITLILKVISDNGHPSIKVRYNQRSIFSGVLMDDITLDLYGDISKTMEFEIELKGKQYDQTRETAVIVQQLCVDGIKLIPDFLHLVQYQNDHHKDINTNYIGYNGTWKLQINEPFYRWHHRHSGQGFLINS